VVLAIGAFKAERGLITIAISVSIAVAVTIAVTVARIRHGRTAIAGIESEDREQGDEGDEN